MKRFRSVEAWASLVIACAMLTGCASRNATRTAQNDDQFMGGGYGEFGEDPVHPGAYQRETPSSGHGPSATQPDSGVYYP